jgi:hypothetical protein
MALVPHMINLMVGHTVFSIMKATRILLLPGQDCIFTNRMERKPNPTLILTRQGEYIRPILTLRTPM